MTSDDEARADEPMTAPEEQAPVSGERAPVADEHAAVADEHAGVADEHAAESGERPTPGPAKPRPRGVRAVAGSVSGRAGRIRPRWRIASAAVLALLVAGAGIWDASLASQRGREQDTRNAENAAMAAAKIDVEQILSYDYRHLSSDLARASSDTTGEFDGQFAVLASQLIGPTATQQHTITKATVPDVSVVSATGNQVVILAFVDQSTTDKSQPKAQQNVSQVQVTMDDIGGRWLVEQFKAL